MSRALFEHGATDSEAEPRHDFSSNANALGPCPYVLSAAKRADLSRYPDPRYLDLRRRLAASHDTTPGQIVVGAGASELIVRLIRYLPGPVLQLGPTFSEYAHGAYLAGRELITASSPDEFLRRQREHACIGFICWPNNPTGDAWAPDFIHKASVASPLVLDLAYGPLCGGGLATLEAAAPHAYRVYSPGKSYGLTGIRGGYVVTPREEGALAAMAPSWVIGRDATAMLAAGVEPEARAWLAQTLPQLHRWRAGLGAALRELHVPVRESPASFLLAEVGDAARIARSLRERGIRVRDATSFGLEQCIRLSAQPPGARRELITALKALL